MLCHNKLDDKDIDWWGIWITCVRSITASGYNYLWSRKMKVAVCRNILNWNPAESVNRFIENIAAVNFYWHCSPNNKFKTIVLIESTDGTCSLLKSHPI